MATVDGRVSRSVAFGSQTRERVELDFAKLTVNGARGIITGASGELIKLFNVFAKDIVEEIFLTLVTAEGGAATADLGDYTTAMVEVNKDDYYDGFDLNGSPALNKAFSGTYAGRKAYTADNVIALLLNDACDAAKIIVEAVISRAQN